VDWKAFDAPQLPSTRVKLQYLGTGVEIQPFRLRTKWIRSPPMGKRFMGFFWSVVLLFLVVRGLHHRLFDAERLMIFTFILAQIRGTCGNSKTRFRMV